MNHAERRFRKDGIRQVADLRLNNRPRFLKSGC